MATAFLAAVASELARKARGWLGQRDTTLDDDATASCDDLEAQAVTCSENFPVVVGRVEEVLDLDRARPDLGELGIHVYGADVHHVPPPGEASPLKKEPKAAEASGAAAGRASGQEEFMADAGIIVRAATEGFQAAAVLVDGESSEAARARARGTLAAAAQELADAAARARAKGGNAVAN